MAFSMGQNFLNSPGADILRMIGIHMPGDPSQQPQAPAQGQPQMDAPRMIPGLTMGAPLQAGPAFAPADVQAGMAAGQPQDLAPIPKPPHGGLFHRIMSAMAAGGGG